MQGLGSIVIVGGVILAILLAVAALIGLCAGAFFAIVPEDEGWLSRWQNGALLSGASFAVLVLSVWGLLVVVGGTGGNPGQGSCKTGHYVSTGKTEVFQCDEYYPPPAVQP